MMGKFQLDNKGQQSVQKFHEKLKVEKTDKQSKLEMIKAQYLEKKKSGKKWIIQNHKNGEHKICQRGILLTTSP